MRKIYTLAFVITLIFTSNNLIAQISQGGLPPSFQDKNIVEEYDEVSLSAPNMRQIELEDGEDEKNGTFKKNARLISARLDMNNAGVWTELNDGGRIWRLKIKSEGAIALGVYYDRFYLPSKSKLFLYNRSKTQVLGAYTEINNPESGLFANELVEGDEVTLEYYEPQGVIGNADISIERVAWVYRDANFNFLKNIDGFGDSDFCQVNINCSPEGDNWQDEKRGVVRIYIVSGSQAGWCSGTMINNVKQDCTPYLLTADHCGEGSSTSNYNQYVFYFNFEANGCSNPIGNPGSNSMTGCSKKSAAAANNASDFLLLELNSYVPASYDTYYNGWDRRNISSPSGVSIHHPAGDIKKISTYTNSLSSSSWGASAYTHWMVGWTATSNGHGVTEGGSSGSPIFNAAGRVIGDLTGGSSYCTQTNGIDLYGKLSYSWESYGTSASTHLKEWLDPEGTGTETLNGKSNVCNDNPPGALFTSTDTLISFGQQIDFTDISSNFPHHWIWIFEGANIDTSYQQNPFNVQYDTLGDFDVKLIVWNDIDSATIFWEDYVSVVPVPSDLDIIGNTVSPNVTPAGYTVTINSLVKNLGQSTSPPNYVKFYLSDNNLWDATDEILDSVLIDSLNQFEQNLVSKDVLLPGSMPLGINYIIYYVDADNTLYESNENNNTAFKAVVIVADLPDLEVNDIIVDSLEIHAGQVTSVSCLIESTGFQDSPAGELTVFLSTDNQLDIASDIDLNTEAISAIVSGSDENLLFDVTIPLNSPQGDMFLLFVADKDNAIEEAEEDNNIGFKEIKIIQPIGIDEIENSLIINVIPNPNSGEFRIKLNDAVKSNGLIRIIDSSGRIVLNKLLINKSNVIDVNIEDLPSGIYLINIIQDSRSAYKKFIVE